MMKCSMCGIRACKNNLENAPQNCPSLNEKMPEIKELYKDEEDYTIAKVSTELSTHYENTRLEEIMKFAKGCGYKKIGLAFCNMFAKETKVIEEVFNYNGFETVSVICKVGGFSREIVEQKDIPHNPMCNPIAQAELLNEEKTDLNVLIGLCVGHDTLFIKHSNAPITVFVVKDRVLAHNPIGAIYMAETKGYKNRLFPPKD